MACPASALLSLSACRDAASPANDPASRLISIEGMHRRLRIQRPLPSLPMDYRGALARLLIIA